jgi:hypothetical protein
VLLIEPDAEVVQRYPRCQTRSQTPQIVRPLSTKAKSVEKLLVDGLHDLADAGDPLPQALGPRFRAVAFRWADDPHSVAVEPSSVKFFALEALVHHVRPRGGRAHATQSRVKVASRSEERLGQRLVFRAGGPETEARDDPSRIDGDEQLKALVPSSAVRPTNVRKTSKPSFAPRRLASLTGMAELSKAS